MKALKSWHVEDFENSRLRELPTADTRWRSCEFCGCRTNAAERICCRRGCDADRRNWNPPAA